MRFKDLKVGECFEFEGGYYLKNSITCCPCIQGTKTCYAGNSYWFYPQNKVKRIVFTGVHEMENQS